MNLQNVKMLRTRKLKRRKLERFFEKKAIGKPRGTFEEKQKQYFEMVKSGKIKNHCVDATAIFFPSGGILWSPWHLPSRLFPAMAHDARYGPLLLSAFCRWRPFATWPRRRHRNGNGSLCCISTFRFFSLASAPPCQELDPFGRDQCSFVLPRL